MDKNGSKLCKCLKDPNHCKWACGWEAMFELDPRPRKLLLLAPHLDLSVKILPIHSPWDFSPKPAPEGMRWSSSDFIPGGTIFSGTGRRLPALFATLVGDVTVML